MPCTEAEFQKMPLDFVRDAHAPDADNAGGIIMLMRMEMIWRIHISAYAAHMHATAATRRLASHTRRLGGSRHLGLVDARRTAPAREARPWMAQEAWCARARDERAGDGQLGPQQLPGQEAVAHLFGQLVGLLAHRSARPLSESKSRPLPIFTTRPICWAEMYFLAARALKCMPQGPNRQQKPP